MRRSSGDRPGARGAQRRGIYRLALILGALTAMGPLAIDTYLPALPTIAREFQTTTSLVQVGSPCVPRPASPPARRSTVRCRITWTRKPVLYIGLMLFIAASLGCALARNVESLIAFRLLQALGGCAPLVVPRAIVRDHFDPRESVRMLSILMLVMGLAPILSPLVGGQLLKYFGWRSIFWVHAIYASVWLTAVTLGLPEVPAAKRQRQRLGTDHAHLRRAACEPRVHGAGARRRPDFLGAARLHLGFAVRVHRALSRHGATVWGVLGINAIGIISASQVNRWLARAYGAVGDPAPRVACVTGGRPCPVGERVYGLRRLRRYSGAAVRLYRDARLRDAEYDCTGHGASRRGGGQRVGAARYIQFILGALAGTLVGVASNGTAVPLAAVVAGCGAGAFAIHTLARVVVSAPAADRR